MARPKEKVTRLKAAAQIQVPQTQEDCAAAINAIGRITRDIQREQAAMNDAIAEITDRYKGVFEPMQKEAEQLQKGVQAYCEAHREALTNGGQTKTGRFVTGEVQWRQRPPSVRVKAQEVVIDTLRRLGLERFVRIKEEINKEAVLADPAAVSGIAGLSIVSGVEDFVITPFEQEAA